MTKTILITGATDGIGLLTAKTLTAEGHNVLLHGRSADKLEAAAREVGGDPETYRADLSLLEDVNALVADVCAKHDTLDVLINNAGVLKVPNTQTDSGLDVRFMVNTIAPWALTVDNDAGRIARPHPAAADRAHVAQLMAAIRELAGA
jgi:short-subunit dehydrogenase